MLQGQGLGHGNIKCGGISTIGRRRMTTCNHLGIISASGSRLSNSLEVHFSPSPSRQVHLYTMFSSFVPLSVPKFGLGRISGAGAVNIQPVTVHDVETIPDKKARRLKHLLKLNHANFAILYNKLRFHNHIPHVCPGSFLFLLPPRLRVEPRLIKYYSIASRLSLYPQLPSRPPRRYLRRCRK